VRRFLFGALVGAAALYWYEHRAVLLDEMIGWLERTAARYDMHASEDGGG
jgi:hypothetical protein